MSSSVIIWTIVTAAACSSTRTPSHDFHYIYSCFESGEVRVDVRVDDEEVGYADFTNNTVVWEIPHPPQLVENFTKQAYLIAKSSIAHCHSVLLRAKKADPGPPRKEAPNLFMHTRYEAEDGVVNTLFCLANNFYPPNLDFTWTLNGAEVRDQVTNLRYVHNGDGTFHRLSVLSITPHEGDVYNCSVTHEATTGPVIRSWEMTESSRSSSVSPAAGFFYVSLVLSLMGITAGAFFFAKQPN